MVQVGLGRFRELWFYTAQRVVCLVGVEMTKRLEAKLKGREPHLEVLHYEGEDHICRSEAENKHHELLVQFFTRFLKP